MILWRAFEHWYEKYEHYISPMAFITGFVLDNLTLTRIDLWIDNLILVLYLCVAGGSVVFLNLYESGFFKKSIFEKISRAAPFFAQFSFGSLFSGFFVFYSRSASVAASWPFLLFLAFLLVGNEFFKKRYLRFTFRTSILFIVVFSYLIFIVPILTGKIGAPTFLISGAASLVFAVFLYLFFAALIPAKIKQYRRLLFVGIGGIYIIFNFFYFTNLIPPIPLSLKEGGVYHSVQKITGGYQLEFEPSPWYALFEDTSSTFHWQPGVPVYIFSSVFAPVKINTTIFHRWFYFDKAQRQWIASSRISFPIVGGRDGGYRGYTLKTNITPGKWRVNVETARGQVLGRIVFRVIDAGFSPKLKTELR